MTIELIASAEALVKHRLAQLAQATHRANNHVVTTLGEDGVWITKTLRDSTPRPPKKHCKPRMKPKAARPPMKCRDISKVKLC